MISWNDYWKQRKWTGIRWYKSAKDTVFTYNIRTCQKKEYQYKADYDEYYNSDKYLVIIFHFQIIYHSVQLDTGSSSQWMNSWFYS